MFQNIVSIFEVICSNDNSTKYYITADGMAILSCDGTSVLTAHLVAKLKNPFTIDDEVEFVNEQHTYEYSHDAGSQITEPDIILWLTSQEAK